MSTSRFQYAYRQNASKLHKAVGEILRSSIAFGEHEAYQEYPVNRVNENYPDSSHHFDWVIPDLKIVIECHGKQHYEPVDWQGGNVEKSIEDYHALKARDFAKKEAALAVDWTYVEVPYFMEGRLNEQTLLTTIDEAKATLQEYIYDHAEERAKAQEEIRRREVEERRAYIAQRKEEFAEKNRAAREKYLGSEKHQETLRLAREFRQKRYRVQKAKQEK